MFSAELLAQVLGMALSSGGDWADIFVEENEKNHALLSDGKIKNVASEQLAGAGLRVVARQQEYYAYTNDLTQAGLEKLAKEIAVAVPQGGQKKALALEKQNASPCHDPLRTPSDVPWEEKISLLRQADLAGRLVSDKIVQVNANYIDSVQNIWVANSNGLYSSDRRVRGRFALTVVAGEGDEKQMGYEAPGAHQGFEFFEQLKIDEIATEAATSALRMLDADYAPQGRMPVIIDSGFGGVIFHEACGHLLEASAVAKKATVFSQSLGEQIASSCVSAVDDGTIPFEWGSCNMDDEGIPTHRNVLIENGVLKSFLVDRLNGERLGLETTGSSRRESYRFAPTSRMNNTFILPGKDSLEAMIADTEYGLYARRLGGGSVNPATGEFNFAVTEGYMIKNGKIDRPVRGAVLIGRGEEILKKIDRVGAELKMAQGVCGAASGWVPVNVGQPPIRVQDLLVGGR